MSRLVGYGGPMERKSHVKGRVQNRIESSPE